MLMRTDPFRDIDRLTEAFFGGQSGPTMMPMDAYREGDDFVVHMDLPGVEPNSIDMTVEKHVLTVHAERQQPKSETERVVAERHYGSYSRQLFLGDTLDVDSLTASYDAGVLTIRIPVAEQAKPRKIEISGNNTRQQLSKAG